MTPRRWVVPIVPGQLHEIIEVIAYSADIVRVVYTVGHHERPLPVLESDVATALGMFLLEATKFCGELREHADDLRSRRLARAAARAARPPRKRKARQGRKTEAGAATAG